MSVILRDLGRKSGLLAETSPDLNIEIGFCRELGKALSMISQPLVRTRPDGTRTYDVELDLHGVVLGRTYGYWNLDDIAAFVPHFKALIHASRARHGGAKILFDLRESAVQSQEVQTAFVEADRALLNEGDRRALVVGSSLKKMQLRRSIGHPSTTIHLSYDEARSWLELPA